MDFNPLDLLAAAALSDKDSVSEGKGSKSKGGSASDKESNSESAESKDADDDSDIMGKTKSSSIKEPIKINNLKVSCDMSPQKVSWSPESYLSCLEKTSIIDELSPAFIKDNIKCLTEAIKEENKKVKEEVDSKCDSLSSECKLLPCQAVKKEDFNIISSPVDDSPVLGRVKKEENDSVEIKDIKKENPSLSPPCEIQDRILPPSATTTPYNVKPEHCVESGDGGKSDTDTAEMSDSNPLANKLLEMNCQELVSLDHPYCLMPGQPCRLISMDVSEEDIDVCSNSSPLTEDSEQRSRNFSLDCQYLKSGIMEGKSAATPQLHQFVDESQTHRKHCSPSKSSPKFDSSLRLSKSSDSSAFKQVSVLSNDRPGPSYGKYKIGTFASFSSSNLELEKYLRGLDSPSDKRTDSLLGDTDRSSKAIHSPVYSPSIQPLLQSPTLDWDRSEAGSETHDDSSDARTPHRLSPDLTLERSEWSHPMYHDHDYCAKSQQVKSISEEIGKVPLAKRKYTKRKSKLDSVNHEKIMKSKLLKKELLKDSFLKSTPPPVPETPMSVTDPVMKANPVGRPKKRPLEKPIEEEIDPETGAKMKITGKFKDDYVYYLSKSKTTSRRRQTPSLPLFSDKIIVPAPKPGDIIVPHLTDADIEIVRTKGRSALNLPERPHMPSISSFPTPQAASAPTKPSILSPLPISQSSELMSDVDSHIVSTILSMENDNLASPSSTQSQDLSQNSDLYSDQTSINGGDSCLPEQVLNYWLSVVKEEEPSLLQSSSNLFTSLPSDPLYSKVDNLASSDIESQIGLPHKVEEANTELLTSHSPLENHSFINTVGKSEVEDDCLPDDLSSLISHSQVTTSSSTTTLEGDSQSSMKSEYSSDLSLLGTPSPLKLTSIQKTLDFLGVKDGEIKLEPCDLDASRICQEEVPNLLALPNCTATADDTPWIVTVTLYFNDVPAIMMGNEPYLRLVDIHKQILPAKDTGILKKRCQLLNIPVLNCTDMHRYFLVQYGKAYNSKSTLIISKDQATSLVRYYATPQPRVGRAEEAQAKRFNSASSDGSNMSPVHVESAPSKKRGCNRSRKGGQTSGAPSPIVGVVDEKPVPVESSKASGDGLNKRTRHKKVNYLEMLKGEEKEKPMDDSISETIESVLKSAQDYSSHNGKFCKDKLCGGSKKSVPKKKVNRSQSAEKKGKDSANIKKKSVDGKKKGKSVHKLLKPSSKSKGSTSKLGKKQKLMTKEGEISSSDIHLMEPLESLNKSNKFKPLKLKVNSLLNFSSQRKQFSSSLSPCSSTKKGLFSRSNSSTSSTTPTEQQPTRVLAVAHQAALSCADSDSHLPSQPADIYLDLFTKSSSACVQCHTCSQFLSVPHFMRHHHVSMDNEWLATEAAHRILVPRNKENISLEERRLWEEFHRLQEAIGGFGEGDDDSDSDRDGDSQSDYEGNEDGSTSLETSGASYLSMDMSHDRMDLSYESQLAQLPPSVPQNNPTPITIDSDTSILAKSVNNVTNHKNLNGDITNKKSDMFTKGDLVSSFPSSVSNSTVLNRSHDSASPTVRTSSRRRKSKQLFSIENYCTPNRKSTEEDGNMLHLSSVPGVSGI